MSYAKILFIVLTAVQLFSSMSFAGGVLTCRQALLSPQLVSLGSLRYDGLNDRQRILLQDTHKQLLKIVDSIANGPYIETMFLPMGKEILSRIKKRVDNTFSRAAFAIPQSDLRLSNLLSESILNLSFSERNSSKGRALKFLDDHVNSRIVARVSPTHSEIISNLEEFSIFVGKKLLAIRDNPQATNLADHLRSELFNKIVELEATDRAITRQTLIASLKIKLNEPGLSQDDSNGTQLIIKWLESDMPADISELPTL